jgi:uncharacterized protein YjiS (DUF1127 family)
VTVAPNPSSRFRALQAQRGLPEHFGNDGKLEKLNAWRRYRQAVRELSQFSNRELSDIGICRCNIEDIVRRPVVGMVAA